MDDFAELIEHLAARIAKSGGDAGVNDSHIALAEDCIAILKEQGVEIRSDDASPVSTQSSQLRMEAILKKVNRSEKIKLSELLALWREFSDDKCDAPAELYAKVGERMIKAGHPLIAYDVLKYGLEHWVDDIRLTQLLALSLARSGAPLRAAAILGELVDSGHVDDETLGILAGAHKTLGLQEPSKTKREGYLTEAYQIYENGYSNAMQRSNQDGAFYNGINAATMALLLNKNERASELAENVAEICLSKPDFESDYWAMATLGECALIRGQFEKSKEYYHKAVELAGNEYASIASTRRNATILFEKLQMGIDQLDDWLPVPTVAVFSGHMTDRPGMPTRFPHSKIEPVGDRLKQILVEKKVGFAYAAAACGADLLFLKALKELGQDYQVVLPFNRERFIESSVAIDEQYDWTQEFSLALDAASNVSVVNEYSNRAEAMHFEYTNLVMTGMALLKSRLLESKVVPIAVWDEKPARGQGGTGGAVNIWNGLGWKTEVVNPTEIDLLQEDREAPQTNPSTDPKKSLEFDIHIRAMLFADVVGYSKLSEEETPLFVKEFMGRVVSCIQESGAKIESSNSWGDAIYLVFSNVEDAGKTALLITEMVDDTNWKELGFAADLSLRTGLHVGPVFCITDPVTGSKTHTGAHVTRAARIEPIVPHGEVYASEAFAALASVENVQSFICDYVGITPMAKGYNDYATYHLRRQ